MNARFPGSAYERFLEKQGLRRATGAYYTPKYIVDYIVKNTVAKQIKGKTPAQISRMRFADIACGSGYFLIGIYEALLDYHQKFYNEELSLQLKQDILLNNIYGIDIDAGAVEIAKSSLLLKMEKRETLLAGLSENIVCGNSLEIIDTEKFDAVIGNPPYVMSPAKKYSAKDFRLQEGKPDLYRLFIEKAFHCTKPGGYVSYIIPHSLLTIPAAKKIRKYLLEDGGLKEVVNFRGFVFKGANVFSSIITCKKSDKGNSVLIMVDSSDKPNEETLLQATTLHTKILKKDILCSEQYAIKAKNKLAEKISSSTVPLSKFCDYTLGMQVYHNTMHSASQITNRIYHNLAKKNETYFPESGGKNIKRYEFISSCKEYVSYGEWCYNKPDWKFCSEPRILIREIPGDKNLICTYSDEVHVPNKATIIVIPHSIDIFLLLGILNSRLIGHYVYAATEKGKQKLFPRVSLTTIRNLPIKNDDKIGPEISRLVQQMIQAKKLLQSVKTDKDKQFIENKIRSLDHQVDNDVFTLYGLSLEEIDTINAK